MRIAVIGAGVSGLVSAHVLHRAHEVTVFEAAPRLGGHVNTVRFRHGDREHAVDTGFIVFNDAHYPNFSKLLSKLRVPSQPTEMSFSVRCDATDLEYNGENLNTLFAQRRNLFNPSFLRMVGDIRRFYRRAQEQVDGADGDVTVQEFVRKHRYGDEFLRDHLVPMGSALWSCPPGRFLQFPIRFVVGFFANHHMLQLRGRPEWRTIEGGSDRYVEAIVRPFRDRIRQGCPVRSVRRVDGGVEVKADGAEPERYDEVVFACHSDQALRVLESPTGAERQALESFPYHANDAVLHTDTSLLPRRRRAWASWNYHVRDGAPSDVAVTYNMNILQRLRADPVFCVTLNDADRVADDHVIRREVYEHPVYTAGTGSRNQEELIRVDGVSFCGAYWGYGFHEDGVRSALAVTRAFGMEMAG